MMFRNIFFWLLALVFLAACGTKKRTVRKVEPQTSGATVYNPNTGIEGAKVKQAELYPMPDDPGQFLKFPIASTREYIDTFSEIAQYEMRAFGIPASITLAQGILESGSGRGALTQKTNNHFGIKCHAGWQGEYDFHDDDERGECFRKYNHPMYSFRDHSIFLSSRSRYSFLFNFRKDDYRKWAYGLKKAGYATDKKYPQKLISLIEQFGLADYDDQVVQRGLDVLREPKQYEVFTHVIQQGDTLYGISKRYGISVEEIKRLNGLESTNLNVGQEINIRKPKTK